MTKEKMAKGQITIYKSLHIKLKLEQYKPHSKPESELRCCGSNKQFQKQDINIIFWSSVHYYIVLILLTWRKTTITITLNICKM